MKFCKINISCSRTKYRRFLKSIVPLRSRNTAGKFINDISRDAYSMLAYTVLNRRRQCWSKIINDSTIIEEKLVSESSEKIGARGRRQPWGKYVIYELGNAWNPKGPGDPAATTCCLQGHHKPGMRSRPRGSPRPRFVKNCSEPSSLPTEHLHAENDLANVATVRGNAKWGCD